MKTPRISLFVLTVAASGAAFAAPDCTKAPRAEWMSEAAMQKQITDAGYKIGKFKISGSCYEIYGRDPSGKRVEIYYNPVDGSVVKKRGGDDD